LSQFSNPATVSFAMLNYFEKPASHSQLSRTATQLRKPERHSKAKENIIYPWEKKNPRMDLYHSSRIFNN
jgi:hypothetical protein